MIGIYARANHPTGYGMADGEAHGYVVLLVRCQDRETVEAVSEKLARGFYGVKGETYSVGHLGKWYGGSFDHLATLPGDEVEDGGLEQRFRSIGDNRFVGVYEADEVLAAD